jgi:hypothetical protein
VDRLPPVLDRGHIGRGRLGLRRNIARRLCRIGGPMRLHHLLDSGRRRAVVKLELAQRLAASVMSAALCAARVVYEVVC